MENREKAKTDALIVHELHKNEGNKYPVWDIIAGVGGVHITYLHKNEKQLIDAFEQLTDRSYSLGCIIPQKDTLGLGLIVLEKGFRNEK